jgi:hypothetical protein
MGRTACTERQCLYKGALYLYLTVELYLYSPYGPYGLYRASVPVQGCTLPFTVTDFSMDSKYENKEHRLQVNKQATLSSTNKNYSA